MYGFMMPRRQGTLSPTRQVPARSHLSYPCMLIFVTKFRAPPTAYAFLINNLYYSTTIMVKDKQQKGRQLLAIQAIQTGRITSVRQAAKLYDLPSTILQSAIQPTYQKKPLPRTRTRLSKTEENILV